MSLRIGAIESTDLFVGTTEHPAQVLRVAVSGAPPGVPVALQVAMAGVTVGVVVRVDAAGAVVAEVGVPATGPVGAVLPVTVTAGCGSETVHGSGTLVVAEPGWTVHLVSHFHYDPVWWNTQAAYTSEWDALPGVAQRHREAWQHTGFHLIRTHLELARRDPDYRFVLAEVDYLKPYWDCHPQDRELIRRLLAQGRLELMGGTYNEPNTNLTSAETTIRNVVYGLGFQRDVLGGDPATAWQLDAFGHDPQFPGMMADAGLTSSSWARGPFHQWGPMMRVAGEVATDASAMQFPSEFEWISPSGRGLLTSYMPAHYSAGWWMDSAATLAEAEEAVLRLFRLLRPAAATRNVLLPVGTDYSPPNKWLTEIHRDWNSRYVWPRLVCSLPRDFFAAVRAELTSLSPQTRDMNPIYTGKDVSYIDTKQAQRVVENLLLDAEKWATLAVLHGHARYPAEALDRAWRLLVYGAHHDAITGTESDQVYLDLLGGWREAYDLAGDVHRRALTHLGGQVDTTGPGWPVLVFNSSSWSRTDVVTVELPEPACGGARLVDPGGAPVPAVRDGHRLTFVARDVPSLGHRGYRLLPAATTEPGWTPVPGSVVANDAYRVAVDPERGGTVTELIELASGRQLLRPDWLGNEILVYDEYPEHPEFHEGPWHLLPTGGPVAASGGSAAESVRVERSAIGERVTVRGEVGPVRFTQVLTLWHGLPRLDCVTRVEDFTGRDHLVRLRWPVGVPRGLPLSEVANAVVGRGFAHPDVDSARHPWTLDNPAYRWFGSGTTARVTLTDPATGATGDRAVGVAEVIVADQPAAGTLGRAIAVALVRAGVTATCTTADGPRYGRLDLDSNLPDARIVVGGPERNSVTAQLLAAAGPVYQAEFARQLAAAGTARLWLPATLPLDRVWTPDADLTGLRDLPVLLVAGVDRDSDAVAELVADLADARIEVRQPAASWPAEPYADRTVAILNRGIPGFAVTADGGLHLSLLRSCTGWPTGVWIDPPRRTAPDGSPFALQHWTHAFEYALTSADGDWRAGGITVRAHDYNHPLVALVAEPHPGRLPAATALLTVSPGVVLTALKATGDPLAAGRPAEVADPRLGVTARVYEPHGRPTTVRLDGPGLSLAGTADLLERPRDGRSGTLGPYEISTLSLAPAPGGTDIPPEPVEIGPRIEPVQPVYAKYWLHNKGPAPMGNQPVSVHLHDRDGTVQVTVASDLTDTTYDGTVWLTAPSGWTADPFERPVRLAPGGWSSFAVELVAGPGAASGVLTARLEHAGSIVEDVLPLGDEPGTLSATLDVAELRLRPGQRGTLTLRLANPGGYAVHGEVQVLSPWGTWDLLAPFAQGFEVGAGGQTDVRVEVTVPEDAAGGNWWALAKVMWFGRVTYSAATRIVVDPQPPDPA
ncbi:glycoside hydrolase family 38 C-terminal domain-containing protein [Plantactinospora solaniradicis]|uniref:Glycoside hydrolase family 38 C-terminal domain-containing protein n=1 Tax=Plantactinospora solaniradicis TaxID=1723736 RepID=A0ABW1K5F9_9ACTN